jgi:hypothetical protein
VKWYLYASKFIDWLLLMKAAVRWVLTRTGLYLAIAALGLTGAALVAYRHLHPSEVSLSYPQNWLLFGGRGLLILGTYTLILLVPLAAMRNKLSSVALKFVLFPFLLIPVALVDLVGSTPPVILIILGIQSCYLIIVRL